MLCLFYHNKKKHIKIWIIYLHFLIGIPKLYLFIAIKAQISRPAYY